MKFVKWPKLLVWHIERQDGNTVCGMPIYGPRRVKIPITRHVLAAGDRLCSSCNRMKDATTMVLA